MEKEKISQKEYDELAKIMTEEEILEKYEVEKNLPEAFENEVKKPRFGLPKFSKKIIVVCLAVLLTLSCIGYGIYAFVQYSMDFDNTKTSLSQAQQNNKNLQKTVLEKESKISENENKIKELGEKIIKLEAEISAKSSELSEKSISLKLAEDKKSELEKNKNDLEKSKDDLEKAKKSAEIDAKNSNLAKQKAQNQAEAIGDDAIKLLKLKDVQACVFGNINSSYYSCTFGLKSISCTGGTYAIIHNCNYDGGFYSCQVSTYTKSVSNCR